MWTYYKAKNQQNCREIVWKKDKQKKMIYLLKFRKLLRLNSYVLQRQNRTHFFSSNFSYHKIISWIWHPKMHLIQTSIVEVIRRAPLISCLISCLFFQAKVSILPHMNARSAASTTFHNQGWPGRVNFHSLQGLNTKKKKSWITSNNLSQWIVEL